MMNRIHLQQVRVLPVNIVQKGMQCVGAIYFWQIIAFLSILCCQLFHIMWHDSLFELVLSVWEMVWAVYHELLFCVLSLINCASASYLYRIKENAIFTEGHLEALKILLVRKKYTGAIINTPKDAVNNFSRLRILFFGLFFCNGWDETRSVWKISFVIIIAIKVKISNLQRLEKSKNRKTNNAESTIFNCVCIPKQHSYYRNKFLVLFETIEIRFLFFIRE